LTVVSGAAVESALLALNSVTTPSQSGINGKNLEETIQNIKRISESMTETNEAILEIISGK
jgi:L-cysteine desulfidase